MRYNISYHPINEIEMNAWYFKVLTNFKSINLDKVVDLIKNFKGNDSAFLIRTYHRILNAGTNVDADAEFELYHGYFIAVIQGLYRKYYYTRDTAFSFLIDKKSYFKEYTKGWEDILEFTPKQKIYNHIHGNYSSGVFIPYTKVVKLLNDYSIDAKIKKDLDTFYSHKRINIFLNALKFSKENKLGLLEATEVVEPNPLDLDKSNCFSYLLNCDIEGAILFRDEVLEKSTDIEKRKDCMNNEISCKTNYLKINF